MPPVKPTPYPVPHLQAEFIRPISLHNPRIVPPHRISSSNHQTTSSRHISTKNLRIPSPCHISVPNLYSASLHTIFTNNLQTISLRKSYAGITSPYLSQNHLTTPLRCLSVQQIDAPHSRRFSTYI
ncbi:unnamed protein product [Protopolystoma xenopodis]|uniref:Uncharacterized protein n=1 Tax=Protopolystoma xenopodis TaxID=117903 RepID=A0A448X5C0_9PLAT|nr:unnamed protein product [Protopolystoma xenopodis]